MTHAAITIPYPMDHVHIFHRTSKNVLIIEILQIWVTMSCLNWIYFIEVCPQVQATQECHHNGGVYCAESCPIDAPVQLLPFDCPDGCVCCKRKGIIWLKDAI